MTIYKYALKGSTILDLPTGAKVIAVQVQRGCPCLWALVDAEQKQMETRHFTFYGTGETLPDAPGDYVGTVQMEGGSLIFHLFEDTRVRK